MGWRWGDLLQCRKMSAWRDLAETQGRRARQLVGEAAAGRQALRGARAAMASDGGFTPELLRGPGFPLHSSRAGAANHLASLPVLHQPHPLVASCPLRSWEDEAPLVTAKLGTIRSLVNHGAQPEGKLSQRNSPRSWRH